MQTQHNIKNSLQRMKNALQHRIDSPCLDLKSDAVLVQYPRKIE